LKRKIKKIETIFLLLLIITAAVFLRTNIGSLEPKHQEEENAKEPGFEAVFAVLGLLAVLYAVFSSKDEKSDKGHG